jgi:DNA-binding MarR family transcriptional regulator
MDLKLRVSRYLQDVLGFDAPAVEPCPQAAALPYFLQDSFEFNQVELAGHRIVLAIHDAIPSLALREVRVQLTRVSEVLGCPVVYCLPTLASYERRNLIEQKVSFIVPGNQMYLPNLGIDLREHFRQGAQKDLNRLTPSTQALLIWQLLNRPAHDEWSPSVDAAALGYTPMTATRAIRELVDAELVEIVLVGRSKHLRLLHPREAVWNKAKNFMRTPVKRLVWVREKVVLSSSDIRLAGLSGLSERTMLSGPRELCFAITAEQWREALFQGVQEIPGPEEGAYQLEIWAYSPAMVANSKAVDPLSLFLSLSNSKDDRVQMALDELQEQIGW